MADNFDIKDFTLTTAKTIKAKLISALYYPGHILYDEAGAEVLGEVTASPAANTVLDRLKAIATAITGGTIAAGTQAAFASAVLSIQNFWAAPANRDHQSTAITASTAETTIVTAGAAGVRNDLHFLSVRNNSLNDTVGTLRDGTGGTVVDIMTIKAGGVAGFSVDPSAGLRQGTAATNWTLQSSVSVTSLEVLAMFVKNPV